ncbi:MAG: exo-alpha-sialidase [Bacteroidetes bacterium]|nr:MAG: exo-alpha-sialidase [Bacteroidota bacterium]
MLKTMKPLFFLFLGALLFLAACQSITPSPTANEGLLTEIPVPGTEESGEPNLFAAEDGQIYLSWVAYLNDTTDALLFSRLEGTQWSAPKMVASGSDWFVNWADFPSLVAYRDGGQSLAAHWLQKRAAGTYDYDVHIAQSFDGGNTWTPAFIPHRDSIAAEHGFVSMVPLSENRIFATWLDGRNTKAPDAQPDAPHSHGGAMTLRAAIFDKNGRLFEETELDDRVCDCCQTAATATHDGLLVAYRNRSETEIRDIWFVRQKNGKWTRPAPVFEDNWLIAGCPVNGPALDAVGKRAAIAWFSAPNGKAQVKAAFTSADGQGFLPPIRIDDGEPLGRVDILMLSEEEALVTWLEKAKDSAFIKIVKVGPSGKLSESRRLTTTSPSRQSGFPVMAKSGDNLVLAWTEVDSLTHVKTAFVGW